MNEHLSQKAEFLLSKTGKPSLQPHVVVTAAGDDDLKDAAFYAVIGPQLYYKVNSLMEAVDTVIKICFVLDLQFTLPARSSWTLVQQAVYEIKTKYDVMSTRMREIMTALQ